MRIKSKNCCYITSYRSKGVEVDNSGQGGISVEVNLADGTFSSFAGREHGGGQFDRHPDTGYMFKGQELKIGMI